MIVLGFHIFQLGKLLNVLQMLQMLITLQLILTNCLNFLIYFAKCHDILDLQGNLIASDNPQGTLKHLCRS